MPCLFTSALPSHPRGTPSPPGDHLSQNINQTTDKHKESACFFQQIRAKAGIPARNPDVGGEYAVYMMDNPGELCRCASVVTSLLPLWEKVART
jgi:hypothetical protein